MDTDTTSDDTSTLYDAVVQDWPLPADEVPVTYAMSHPEEPNNAGRSGLTAECDSSSETSNSEEGISNEAYQPISPSSSIDDLLADLQNLNLADDSDTSQDEDRPPDNGVLGFDDETQNWVDANEYGTKTELVFFSSGFHDHLLMCKDLL